MNKVRNNFFIIFIILLFASCKSVSKIVTNNDYVYGTDYTEIELQKKAVLEFLKIHHSKDCLEECTFSIFYEFQFWDDCYEEWDKGYSTYVEDFRVKKNRKLSTNGVELYRFSNGTKVLFGADNRNLRSYDYQFSPLLYSSKGRQLSMLARKGTKQSDGIRSDMYIIYFHLLGRNEIYVSSVSEYYSTCLFSN